MAPLAVLRAGCVATGPMLILQEAMTARIRAFLGLHAIHAIVRRREDVTIPRMLVVLSVNLGPSVLFEVPLLGRVASLVATCPMIILPEAMTVRGCARCRIHAVLTIVCWRELVTCPCILIVLSCCFGPEIVYMVPLLVRAASLIAAGPMFILSPAPVVRVLAAQSVTAILPIIGA